MAKFDFEIGNWVDDITKQFGKADKSVIPVMKAALYEGAKVLADSSSKPKGFLHLFR